MSQSPTSQNIWHYGSDHNAIKVICYDVCMQLSMFSG